MSFLPRRVGGGMLALLALLIAPTFLFAQENATISVVGSGIVTPLLEQVGASLEVSVTGTNQGFAQFCLGQADIVASTRPISGEEDGNCLRGGVTYLELLIAHNLAAFVTSTENSFAQCLTTEQLNTLFAPSSQTTNWNQVDANFPDTPLTILVPPQNTPIFAVLDGVVDGDGTRSDATTLATEDIISAVSANPGAVGVVPLPAALAGGVKIVEVNAGDAGCAAPSAESMEGRTYTAGQRLFVYVNANNLSEPGMTDLLNALVGESAAANAEVQGFTAATTAAYENDRAIITEVRRGRDFSADVTGFNILASVSGTVNLGGTGAGANYLNAVTTAFSAQYPGVTANLDIRGEQAGIASLCAGTLDFIAVTGDLTQEQLDLCAANNITLTTIDLGQRAVVLVANGASPFLQCLTLQELGAVWSAASTGTITTWDQARADFPATPMTLFAPSTGGVLTDLLLLNTVGVNGINRVDIELSDDVTYRAAATANVEGALTFMGWDEYQDVLASNQANIQLVSVGENCVQPSEATIADGTYPLTQSLKLVVSNVALARPEVQSVLWYAASDSQYGLLTAESLVGVSFDELADLRQMLQEAFLQAQLDAAARLTAPTPEVTAQPAPGATEASEPPPTDGSAPPTAEATPPVGESTPPVESTPGS